MYQRYFKRMFDIVLSAVGVVLLSPLFLIIYILIRLDSPGSPILKQKRMGANREVFEIYKFRTMIITAPKYVPTAELGRHADYTTHFGLFLRKTSLDEILQLFNIIKGDMSIIGPRPVVENDVKLLALRKKYQIEYLKPGISGLAQVCGRDSINAPVKADYDKKYAEKITFLNDIKIVLKTVQVVLKREGFSEDEVKDKASLTEKMQIKPEEHGVIKLTEVEAK